MKRKPKQANLPTPVSGTNEATNATPEAFPAKADTGVTADVVVDTPPTEPSRGVRAEPAIPGSVSETNEVSTMPHLRPLQRKLIRKLLQTWWQTSHPGQFLQGRCACQVWETKKTQRIPHLRPFQRRLMRESLQTWRQTKPSRGVPAHCLHLQINEIV